MTTHYLATLDGREHEIEIAELAPHCYRLKVAGAEHEVDVRQVGPASFSILVDDRSFDFDVVREAEELIVASRGGTTRVTLIDAARRVRRAAADDLRLAGRVELKAMMPGRIVEVLVQAGDEVTRQQGLIVVEAMKMENEIKSPKAGKVTAVKVAPGQTVEKGELLVVID